MAAFHVVYDVIGTRKSSRHAKRYAQFTGLFVISFTMGLATVAYFTGRFDLSALFGMIGGLMAPIVAGVFPVLIYVSCRARGVAVRSAVGEILSNRFAALMAMSIFLAVFVIQAMSETYYPVWYQMTSLGMAGVVCTLVVHLIRKRRFSPGFVIQIFRSFDGWNPAEWQFYHNGLETELEALWWKTTPNSKMELFTEGTSAARVLSAVELMTPVKLGENIDILIYDKTSHAITTPTHSRVNETMLLIEL